MNSLDRNLKKGEKIVLSSEFYNGSEQDRTVVAEDGFGMYTFTSGSAIVVTRPNGSTCRVEGHEIDKEATDRLTAKA